MKCCHLCVLFIGLVLSFMIMNLYLNQHLHRPQLESLKQPHAHGVFSFSFGHQRTKIVQRLREAIQIPTISPEEKNKTNWAQFEKLHLWLQNSFPRVYSQTEVVRVGERNMSIIFIWKGSQPELKPLMWTSHLDVVPIEKGTEELWVSDPFSAKELEDGYLYGRGLMDDKMGVLGLLESINSLMEQNYVPDHTIVLGFGHDEEVGGYNGARFIAQYLSQRGIFPEFVHDEGSLIIEGMIPGINGKIATIGTSEKGFGTVEVKVETQGGHASMPPTESTIGILSQAIAKIEANPMPASLEGSTADFFDFLAPHMALPVRFILANRWLFEPLIIKFLESDPIKAALLRTTQAVTIIQGGFKDNVLPKQASATINLRVHPKDSIESTIERMRRVVNDPRVKISEMTRDGFSGRPSSPVTDPNQPPFQVLEQTLQQWDPDVIAAPVLFLANTDTLHYWNITKHIFRFSPILCSREDIARIHGVNERMTVEGYVRLVEFYYHWIINADANLHSTVEK